MNIQELILAGLQTKFTGVDAAILTRIATKKAEGVTDVSQVNSIVEGVGFSDVLNSYGEFRANTVVTSAVTNYEKKHGLKDGKPIENPNPNPNPKPEDKKDDDVPAWAQALIDSNKSLSTELSALKQEKLQATRQEQVIAKAKEYGILETLAKRYSIPDDADLDTYFKDVKLELANVGFQGVTPPESAETKIEKESESIANMISEGQKLLLNLKSKLNGSRYTL